MSVDIATYVHDLAVAAKAASVSLATASDEQRQEAVRAMAAALRNGVDSIVAANELDMSAARAARTSPGSGGLRPPLPGVGRLSRNPAMRQAYAGFGSCSGQRRRI